MYLKTKLFLAFSATALLSLLSPAICLAAPGQSRGFGNYLSSFRIAEKRHRDNNDVSGWPYNYLDNRASMDRFEALDADHPSRALELQTPKKGLIKNEDLKELLLDRVIPTHFEEYVDDDYYNDADIQRGVFNVYLPDGRPQDVNFEGKFLRQSQF